MGSLLVAQDDMPRNYDYIYTGNIATVRFHLNGLDLSYPIIDLDSPGQLRLSFDDLDADVKNYYYTLQHCDADWTPSDLDELEYNAGFIDDRIDDYQYSFATRVPYTHYELLLPNDDVSWTKSGNYLLNVYDGKDKETLVITRRFMVVEPIVDIMPQVVVPSMVGKSRTYQEIDFIVNHENLEIRNPRSEINAIILQNGRWDNAITGIAPLFLRDKEMIFNYQNKVIFPAGKEFRYFDMRSLRTRLDNVAIIDNYDEGYEVAITVDKKRGGQPHLFREDINGKYVIGHLNQPEEADLRGDYADVLLTLKSSMPMSEGDVYFFGAISDWQVRPEYKMVYNPAVGAYLVKALLKQGYYDYQYVIATPRGALLSDTTEGDWYETENDYTILVYYRPFGTRYDRLIGGFTFDSTDNRR